MHSSMKPFARFFTEFEAPSIRAFLGYEKTLCRTSNSSRLCGMLRHRLRNLKHRCAVLAGQTCLLYQLTSETMAHLNQNASNAFFDIVSFKRRHHAAGLSMRRIPNAGWWDSAIGRGQKPSIPHIFLWSLLIIWGGCVALPAQPTIILKQDIPLGGKLSHCQP